MRIVIKILLISSCFYSNSISLAQNFQNIFETKYGVNNGGFSFTRTSGKGYMLAGITDEALSNAFLTKLDSNGNIVFTNAYAPSGYKNYVRSISRTHNGGYIISGTSSDTTIIGWYLMNVDGNGTINWINRYKGAPQNIFAAGDAMETSDRGFLVTGSVANDTLCDCATAYVGKTDSLGNILWFKKFGTTRDGVGYALTEIIGQGYFVGGADSTFINLIKLDSSGNLVFFKKYDILAVTSFPDMHMALQNDNKGNIYISVAPYSIVMKVNDNNGNLIWGKKYTLINSKGSYINDLLVKNDTTIVITGNYITNDSLAASNGFITKLDENGIQKWAQLFNISSSDKGLLLDKANQNGIVVAGVTKVDQGESQQLLIFKTDAGGNNTSCITHPTSFSSIDSLQFNVLTDTTTNVHNISMLNATYSNSSLSFTVTDVCSVLAGVPKVVGTVKDINIYPNPITAGYLHIDGVKNTDNIDIFNMLGQKVLQLKPQKIIDLNGFEGGMYFVKIYNASGEKIFKVIIQ